MAVARLLRDTASIRTFLRMRGASSSCICLTLAVLMALSNSSTSSSTRSKSAPLTLCFSVPIVMPPPTSNDSQRFAVSPFLYVTPPFDHSSHKRKPSTGCQLCKAIPTSTQSWFPMLLFRCVSNSRMVSSSSPLADPATNCPKSPSSSSSASASSTDNLR